MINLSRALVVGFYFGRNQVVPDLMVKEFMWAFAGCLVRLAFSRRSKTWRMWEVWAYHVALKMVTSSM